MISLTGKTALITGAAGGIGQALCALFAELGATIIAADRDAARLSALATASAAKGVRLHALHADITDEAAFGTAFAAAVAAAGNPPSWSTMPDSPGPTTWTAATSLGGRVGRNRLRQELLGEPRVQERLDLLDGVAAHRHRGFHHDPRVLDHLGPGAPLQQRMGDAPHRHQRQRKDQYKREVELCEQTHEPPDSCVPPARRFALSRRINESETHSTPMPPPGRRRGAATGTPRHVVG